MQLGSVSGTANTKFGKHFARFGSPLAPCFTILTLFFLFLFEFLNIFVIFSDALFRDALGMRCNANALTEV